MRLGVLWASERDRLGRCPRVAIHVVCRNAVCERDPGHTTSQDKTPQKWWFDTTQGALKRLERDDRPGVQNARNGLDLLVDKMADVGAVLDIELHQQVEVAGGRIDFGRDLGIGQRIGNRIAFLRAGRGAFAQRHSGRYVTSITVSKTVRHSPSSPRPHCAPNLSTPPDWRPL